MTRTLLQQALDALEAALSDDQPYIERGKAAITALRSALAAPQPEPVALESVHLTRDTQGMCVVRVNGRVAIRDNGDIIDHMATLEWFAAPPAAPADMVMVPREPTPEMIAAGAHSVNCNYAKRNSIITEHAYRSMIAAAPAPAVPLTPPHTLRIGRKHFGHPTPQAWFDAARELEQAHGITSQGGGK